MNKKLKKLSVFILALLMIVFSIPNQVFALEKEEVVTEETQNALEQKSPTANEIQNIVVSSEAEVYTDAEAEIIENDLISKPTEDVEDTIDLNKKTTEENLVDQALLEAGKTIGVEEDPVDVQRYLEENFTLANIKYWQISKKLEDTNIDWHLQMPTNLLNKSYATGTGGLTNEQYTWLRENFENEVFSSNDKSVLDFSTYRGVVYRPLPGESAKQVIISINLTHKIDPTKTYSSSIELTVLPFTQDELNEAVNLMDEVKGGGFAEALLGENISADEITDSLKSFNEIRFDEKGNLFVARKYADKTHLGIEFSDVSNNIESTRNDIIPSHTLKVNQPAYNTSVTLKSELTHAKFKEIAIALANGSIKPSSEGKAAADIILNQLYRVPVEATYKVVGTTGKEDPNADHPMKAALIVEGSKILNTKEDKEKDHHEIWFNSGELKIAKGTSIINFVDKTLRSSEDLVELKLDTTSGWLTSIEFKDYPLNKTGETNGTSSSWMWYIKKAGTDNFVKISTLDIGDADAFIQDGDVIKLKFINDPRYPNNVMPQTPEHPIELKDDSDVVGWTGFRGDSQNRTPVREVEEISATVREKVWDSLNTNINEWGYPSTISDLLSINGKIFYATENKLIRLNESGEPEAEAILAGSIEYFSRITYSNGMIIIPVQGGGVQAIDPETMQSLWVVGSIDSLERWEPAEPGSQDWIQMFYPVQSLGTPFVDNGIVYIPITAPQFPDTVGGIIRAIDMSTGKEIWQYKNDMNVGFYWGGATKIGDYLIIGDDSGLLHAISIADGTNKGYGFDTYGSQIRSTIVNEENNLYFTTTDGKFHSVKFNPDGGWSMFYEHKKVQFASGSTSTPTIYDGKAYVGGIGGDNGWNAPGVFAVIDLASMEIEYRTEEIAGEVKSAPLVLYDANDVYVYFTGNSEQGLLYVYHAGKVEIAYRPNYDQAQYTTATPIVDHNGNIYYTTDAAVIALKSGTNSKLNDFELRIKTTIGEASFESESDLELTRHLTLNITDATDRIKALYGEDIAKQLSDIEYVSFQTSFEGESAENPPIKINVAVDQNYLPLAADQEYKLFKLSTNNGKLIPVELGQNKASVQTSKKMSIMPILLSQLSKPLITETVSGNLISFSQLMQDNITYVLAAVSVTSPTPEQPEQNNEPETPVVDRKQDDQNTNKALVTTTGQASKQLAKTGEQSMVVLSTILLIMAGSLILLKNKPRETKRKE